MATPSSAPDGEGGVFAHARRFFAATIRYVKLRWRLAAMEGKEAAGQVVKLLMIGVTALVFVAVGWLFFCLAMVFLLSKELGPNGLMWSALIVAGAHFLGAALLGLALNAGRHTVFFPLTTEELKKDQAWLDEQTPKKPL